MKMFCACAVFNKLVQLFWEISSIEYYTFVQILHHIRLSWLLPSVFVSILY